MYDSPEKLGIFTHNSIVPYDKRSENVRILQVCRDKSIVTVLILNDNCM